MGSQQEVQLGSEVDLGRELEVENNINDKKESEIEFDQLKGIEKFNQTDVIEQDKNQNQD